MELKHLHKIIFIFILIIFNIQCENNNNPVSSSSKIYDTPYGKVSREDDYPLYNLDYTADYNFDEYLQTGSIPDYTLNKSKKIDFCCSCFSAIGEDSRLLGRNYDWSVSSVYYVLHTHPDDAYASISTVDLSFFNYDQSESPDHQNNLQILRTLPYFPFDGINEKGVSIGMNAVPAADSPHDPSKITIGELQLIRLVLDYASSVEQSISLIQQYNVLMEIPPIHYLIADSSGQSVIIEFVNDKMEIFHNSHPYQVTTNFVITGTEVPQHSPCWRYNIAWEYLEQKMGTLSENDAFDLLHSVSVSSTRWSVVLNMKMNYVRIAMGRDFENIHLFHMKK